jgi:hypothetical protein
MEPIIVTYPPSQELGEQYIQQLALGNRDLLRNIVGTELTSPN